MEITVGIFLLTKSNKLLICHPTNARWNQWSIPKGLIDEGEWKWAAGIRELYEETNIEYEQIMDYVLEIKDFDEIKYKNRSKYLKPYFIKLDNDDVSEFDLKCSSIVEIEGHEPFPEMDKHKWVSIDEAMKLIHDTQKEALNQYLKNGNSINI